MNKNMMCFFKNKVEVYLIFSARRKGKMDELGKRKLNKLYKKND